MTGPKSKLELGGEKVAYGSTPSPSSRKAWPAPPGPALALLFVVVVATVKSSACPVPGNVGANCSVKVHVPSAPRVMGEENGRLTGLSLHTTFVTENAELEPCKETPLTMNEAPPVFIRVRTWVLLLFTYTGPKLIGPMFEY